MVHVLRYLRQVLILYKHYHIVQQYNPLLILLTTIRPETEISGCPFEWKKIYNQCYIVTDKAVMGFNAPAKFPSRSPGSHLAKIDSYDHRINNSSYYDELFVICNYLRRLRNLTVLGLLITLTKNIFLICARKTRKT